METLIQESAKYGIFCLLFVTTGIYLIKQNQEDKKRFIEREDKYYAIIETLASKLPEIMNDLKIIMTDLNIIKSKVNKE